MAPALPQTADSRLLLQTLSNAGPRDGPRTPPDRRHPFTSSDSIQSGGPEMAPALPQTPDTPSGPSGRTTRSDGVFALPAGADADGLAHRQDEDLAVADRAGLGGLADDRDHLVHQAIGHHDLDLDLGQEVDRVLRAAVELGVPL